MSAAQSRRFAEGLSSRLWLCFALVPLCCAMACSSRIDPEREQGALYWNLVRAPGIEVVVEEQELLRAASLLVERWRRVGNPNVTLVRAGDARDPRRVRVLIGSAANREAQTAAATLGLIRTEGNPPERGSLANIFESEAEACIACFRDPLRPDLPLTLLYGSRLDALPSLLERLAPGARPGIALLKESEIFLTAELALDGALRPATIRRHESARGTSAEGYAIVRPPADKAIEARVRQTIPGVRHEAYLARLPQHPEKRGAFPGRHLDLYRRGAG